MLNKTEGELLPILGRGVVAPAEKWAGVMDMLQIAADAAATEFVKVGAPQPVTFRDDNILIQEYHLQGLLVFIFWMRIKGQDMYYTYKFELSDKIIQEFVVTGKWPGARLPHPTMQ